MLAAGAGINVTDAPDGRKRVAVTNPRPQAGRDLTAADKFAQRALDPDREWTLEAIQKSDPHVVRLEYDARTRTYQGTFPISADGAVTGQFSYVRAGTRGNPDAGKFKVTTLPLDTSRTLANLFAAGTVDELILQMGATEEEAVTSRKTANKVVKDTLTTNTLALVTKDASSGNPTLLSTAAPAYARVNFRFTDGAVTGWNRYSSKDIDKAQLRKIKPGALAVIDNGVVLVGTTRAGQVFAFKNGRRFPGADVTGIGIDPGNGLAYNRTTNKLAIIAGGYREPIKVFKLSRPGTADQRHDEVAGDEIKVSKLAVGRLGSVWCMAWHDNDLWVIDRFGLARVFKSGTAAKHVKLPGTEGVGAATFVGDVLIYGGGGDAVYAYNVATDERVPGLELTGSQVTAGVSGFRALTGAAYDPDAEILYLGGLGFYVAAFKASKAVTAYPEASLYGYRTMSKARLQAEAREQHVKSLDETAGTLSWVKVAADGTETPAAWTPNHVGALIATLSPAAGLYSASTRPPVNWVIEGTAPAGFDRVSPARGVSEMNVPRRLPSSWLGLVFRVKIGAAIVSEVVLPWTGYAASVAWDQRVTGLGSNVYLVSATNDATVRRVKIVLQREWTVTTVNADKDVVYLVGNGETLLANTVFELLAWV